MIHSDINPHTHMCAIKMEGTPEMLSQEIINIITAYRSMCIEKLGNKFGQEVFQDVIQRAMNNTTTIISFGPRPDFGKDSDSND